MSSTDGPDAGPGNEEADAEEAPTESGYDSEYVLRRVVVTILVAAVVVVAATLVVPTPSPPPSVPVDNETMNLTEYEASLNLQKLPAEGEVTVDRNVSAEEGLVVIDNSHGNRVSRADLAPIIEALVDLNYRVKVSDEDNLTRALADADAFIVADPGFPYDEEDVSAIRNFTDRGGHLLVLAEPTRRRVSVGLTGTSIVGVPSFVDNVVHEYNTTVDARYLYNQRHNDGNFKHVLGRQANGARIGAERTAFYTAAPLETRTGRPLIFAAAGTRISMTDAPGTYALAVRDGNFVAVGDTSFLRFQHYNVADNERFIAYLVEFLASGDGALPDDDETTPTATPTPTSTPTNETNSSASLPSPGVGG